MHHASVALLPSLLLLVALPAHAGESPYNPGAPSNSDADKKIPRSYYCTAQGIGESKWYVTGFEPAPCSGTPQCLAFQGDASGAFTQYMNATYGRNKVMYAHCTVGESKGLRPSWERMQPEPRFKQTVHVNWSYGQVIAPASSNAAAPSSSAVAMNTAPAAGY